MTEYDYLHLHAIDELIDVILHGVLAKCAAKISL